jgi:hypothetical protein
MSGLCAHSLRLGRISVVNEGLYAKHPRDADQTTKVYWRVKASFWYGEPLALDDAKWIMKASNNNSVMMEYEKSTSLLGCSR